MPDSKFLPRSRFQDLIDALHQAGYQCMGPQVRDGAVVFDELLEVGQLPHGCRDEQGPGRYRMHSGGPNPRFFSWANGPQALKPLLFAPRETLWRCKSSEDGGIGFEKVLPEIPPLAVIGVRACDLSALAIHDAHFLLSTESDAAYQRRRENLLLIAVNCSHPAATCFCVSTGDGPSARGGFDLVFDELDDGFVVRAGSNIGRRTLESLHLGPAGTQRMEQAAKQLHDAAFAQQRGLPSRDLYKPLFDNLEHPRWQQVAGRCLSCGNCTSVCPTCFCHAHGDVQSLDGNDVEHYREWDSCFTAGHSYIAGIVIRDNTAKRYRQWLSHKLGSWHEQFGRSGCVGCGRCITWCPVGIDITEEAAAICAPAEEKHNG